MSTRYHPCSLAGDAPSLAGDKEKKKEKKGVAQDAVDFVIKPEATPPLDTSKWPLLLKDYDQLNVRTGHYTPIPNGHTPLKTSVVATGTGGVTGNGGADGGSGGDAGSGGGDGESASFCIWRLSTTGGSASTASGPVRATSVSPTWRASLPVMR